MLVKTEAIVVKKTAYTDHSAVVKLFTKEFGLTSFIIQGLHGKQNKNSLIQPGTIIELVFHKKYQGLMRAKELSLISGWGYRHLPIHDQVRWFFLELLNHVLHEEQPEESLFLLSKETFTALNEGVENLSVLPIYFLYNFCKETGHALQIDAESMRKGLDILGGGYANDRSLPIHTIGPEDCTLLHQIAIEKRTNVLLKSRRVIIGHLLAYIQIHVIPGKTLQSLNILQDITQGSH